jgi:hypothetical protein
MKICVLDPGLNDNQGLLSINPWHRKRGQIKNELSFCWLK